eukprot:CAMPEP_0181334912 /NCGR_PEP_ID=MMETSP1101-20121128/26537_1 /TAXON_ID=46948 /ORGANISM="Rhodomonas abbreviata, Strain Caron Lab Isolate" /LENGTH=116 /DNA_ID=CAMNT_0023444969 /DNA_START=20 /DNA_END=367 /DNA_ORIENTATION=+
MTSFVLLLAAHPSEWHKVGEEVRAVTRNFKEPVTLELLNRLPFLNRCILETLRLCPPAALHVREALSSLTLPSGQIIPRGCQIILAPPLLHCDQATWPDPLAFKPQRFESPPTQGS